jgi:hypothetical protein
MATFEDISKIINERTNKSIKNIVSIQHGGRFAIRRRCYRENEEQIEVLMGERAIGNLLDTIGNLDTMQFLDAIYRRIGD